ncbi:MAG: MobF family relaxase [Alphaproteobacteria bacterium]
MLSISPAAKGGEYYRGDNYYFDDGRAQSRWLGEAAKTLGLNGVVKQGDYQRLYDGRLQNGVKLGRMVAGEWRHDPGVDLTFAAPKSVSILAQVIGDRRLIDAHDRAVEAALAWIEAEHTVTRIRCGNRVQHVHTSNLIAAVYRHDISRAEDPHLHSHAVVMNVTRDVEGRWRSLDNRYLWQDLAVKEGGLRYQQELARLIAALGYEVKPKNNGTFEIVGVPDEAIALFSKRTRAMEAYLAGLGIDINSASTEQRNLAMQRTRPDKKAEVTPDQLQRQWRNELGAMGYSLDGLVRRSKEQAATPNFRQSQSREGMATARAAVMTAAESLVERDAIFADRALRELATVFSLGKASGRDIDGAIKEAALAGELIFREAKHYVSPLHAFTPATGWTMPAALRAEQTMIAIERAGRSAADAPFDAEAARHSIEPAIEAARRAGFTWNRGQRNAAIGLLSSPHLVTAIQGYAGTAKTTTVLASYVGAMAAKGHRVAALAPTHAAAEVLGEAVGLPGKTVARHLIDRQRRQKGGRSAHRDVIGEVWMVDEASLLGAKAMRDLLQAATHAEARVVLVGDVLQLGSVAAGRAFAQLQEEGMNTFVLDAIVRQKNPALRRAIRAGIADDVAGMLHHLEHGGGSMTAIGGGGTGETRRQEWQARIDRIADLYTALSAQERRRTLVIDPSREGRDALNAAIQKRRAERGELAGPLLAATILTSRDLTHAQKRLALSYGTEDVIRFQTDYGSRSSPVCRKGGYYQVLAVSPGEGRVTLRDQAGRDIDWRPARFSKVEVYTLRSDLRLHTGDSITFTRDDPAIGARNGRTANVLRIDPDSRTVVLARSGEVPMRMQLDQHRHWDLGYARTIHGAQGMTAERALIHAESWRANLLHRSGFYTAESRARIETHTVTDDVARLKHALELRSGAEPAAKDLSAIRAGRQIVTAMQRTASARSMADMPEREAPLRGIGR